jgi:hypothetical protein
MSIGIILFPFISLSAQRSEAKKTALSNKAFPTLTCQDHHTLPKLGPRLPQFLTESHDYAAEKGHHDFELF